MRQFDRELTPIEQRIINLCKVFEKAIDNHKLTLTLNATRESAELIQRGETDYGAYTVLKADFNPKSGYYEITFTMTEFRSYLDWVMQQAGMTLYVDGSIMTKDNLTITNEYLN